jgi:cytochrome oxidase Cu insertion factor (SCO1/SenC/PrrC family)
MIRTIALLSLLVAAALAPRVAFAADQPALDKRADPVAVGQVAPDFTLEDQNGRKLILSSERGKPVVLVFYRGHW